MSGNDGMIGRNVTRRGLLRSGAVAAGALLMGARGVSADNCGARLGGSRPGRDGFRFVHLADIHVQPELQAAKGFAQCLETIHALDPRPDFILTGGDLVMDILAVREDRAMMLFDLYLGILRDSDIPVRHCIGNHDVFGWGAKDTVSPEHVQYGKKMVQERLELPRTTYAFEHRGWLIGVVDSILPAEDTSYLGGVTAEDLEWLDDVMGQAGSMPKVLCAHIPFLSIIPLRTRQPNPDGSVTLTRGMVCQNAADIMKLCREHEVKLTLCGHLHQNERITYDGTTHINSGAVSGAWWKGSYHGNPEGFGVIDLRSDGTFTHTYHTYGWDAEAAGRAAQS